MPTNLLILKISYLYTDFKTQLSYVETVTKLDTFVSVFNVRLFYEYVERTIT